MTLIKSLKISKKNIHLPNDWNYDIDITNEGLLPVINLIKLPIDTLGLINLFYTLPVGGNIANKFNWATPHTINFDLYNLNDVSHIYIATDPIPKKAHIAIRDTEFPPPSRKFIKRLSNVTDAFNKFSLTELEITRNSPTNKTSVSVTVTLKSITGELYETIDTKFRFQKVTLPAGNEVDAILLYPKEKVGGLEFVTFTLPNLDLSTPTSSDGIAILIVEGNFDIPAEVPDGIMKKGMFWIE